MRKRLREQLGKTSSPQVASYTYLLPEAGQSSERYHMLGYFDSTRLAPELANQ